MRLVQSELHKISLESMRPYVANVDEFFSPREHYRLLAYLSSLVAPGKTAIDVGTHLGDSAVALAFCGRRVESFDVVDKTSGRPRPDSVRYNVADLFDPAVRDRWERALLESAIVVVDVDPHEGTRELELVRWLQDHQYRGIVVLDDVWYFKPMRDNLWYRIEPRYRTDATSLGHWSGTGIVSFGQRVEVEDQPDTSNWTLVTGYFDLTKKGDANDAIRARPASHYVDMHGSSVLSADKNLVVFCEPELAPKIWSMRPLWLHDRTRVIEMAFEDFHVAKRLDQIIANRGGPACSRDPRNTASYYLFCMARYAMVRRVVYENPFKSTHFAWVNICIERMGFNNLIYLDDALGTQRDRFSTCWIDYVSKREVEDLATYFGPDGCRHCAARCTMCSGFFTGNARYMREVCGQIESEFARCLRAGYGHADEQLYPIAYYKNPDAFDWYVGDYTEMVTNYAHVREHSERPIRNLIRNSLAAGDHAACARACDIVLRSVDSGKCRIDHTDLIELMLAKAACETNL